MRAGIHSLSALVAHAILPVARANQNIDLVGAMRTIPRGIAARNIEKPGNPEMNSTLEDRSGFETARRCAAGSDLVDTSLAVEIDQAATSHAPGRARKHRNSCAMGCPGFLKDMQSHWTESGSDLPLDLAEKNDLKMAWSPRLATGLAPDPSGGKQTKRIAIERCLMKMVTRSCPGKLPAAAVARRAAVQPGAELPVLPILPGAPPRPVARSRLDALLQPAVPLLRLPLPDEPRSKPLPVAVARPLLPGVVSLPLRPPRPANGPLHVPEPARLRNPCTWPHADSPRNRASRHLPESTCRHVRFATSAPMDCFRTYPPAILHGNSALPNCWTSLCFR